MLRKLILFGLLTALSLAACAAPAAAPSTDYYRTESTTSSGAGSAGGAAPELAVVQDAVAAPVSGNAATVDRLVIKNATLSLVVKDPSASVTAITTLAGALGGYVVSSSTYQTSVDAVGNKIMQANISIRVPVERLDEALAQLEALAVTGQAASKSITGDDVTAQYTDLESQLTNLQAAETQLQKIMEGATKTEDVLAVYNQLVTIRGQIEQVKGQMKYYRESAALSLISLDLVPDALSQPLQVAGWRPEGIAKDALEALVHSLQALAEALIWGGVYCLPLGLLFGLPLYFVGRWAWRKLRKPKTVKA